METPAAPRRRYFDNAATSWPKPPGVADAVRDYLLTNGSSAGRGSYREAVESGRMLQQCRDAVRRVFGAKPADHVIFGLNGTDALNIAMKAVLRPGDHVVTSAMDHNSVLRPLSAARERLGVTWDAVEPETSTTILDPAAVEYAITPRTKLVCISHASNVTGAIQPIEEIARRCAAHGVLFLLDAAQSAGHVPIDMGRTPIDLLACPGHKGLLGPPGTGVLVVRAGVESQMQSVREGGTGSASEKPVQPEALPDRFESGCHNACGIAGLLVALRWIQEKGVDRLRAHEVALCERLMRRFDALAGRDASDQARGASPAFQYYGPRAAAQRVGVFSVRVAGLEPAELSALLEAKFGLLTRSGLHCAPYAHRALATTDLGGATRFSMGPFTTEEDVDAAAEALEAIVREMIAVG